MSSSGIHYLFLNNTTKQPISSTLSESLASIPSFHLFLPGKVFVSPDRPLPAPSQRPAPLSFRPRSPFFVTVISFPRPACAALPEFPSAPVPGQPEARSGGKAHPSPLSGNPVLCRAVPLPAAAPDGRTVQPKPACPSARVPARPPARPGIGRSQLRGQSVTAARSLPRPEGHISRLQDALHAALPSARLGSRFVSDASNFQAGVPDHSPIARDTSVLTRDSSSRAGLGFETVPYVLHSRPGRPAGRGEIRRA
ncbi:unnamed protein product [Calypogeia fissa]